MKAVYSTKLNSLSNSIVNEAIRLASATGCSKIDCCHALIAILKLDSDIENKFRKVTGFGFKEFSAGYLIHGNVVDNQRKEKETDLDLKNASNDFSDYLNEVIGYAVDKGCTVTSEIMYNVLVGMDDNEALRVLKKMGVELSVLRDNLKSPLDSMPVTASMGIDLNNSIAQDIGGKMYDAVIGRDKEIDELIETLGRRKKCNPIIVGDPGVGKTAIVEELARRINSGNVPKYLKDVHIISVNLSDFLLGTSYRGAFEEKIKCVINEAMKQDVILFFDEFHLVTSVGNGGAEGGPNLANMLKPVLTGNSIKVIGATTTKEYSKFIERDEAFERRVQKIMVEEPDVNTAVEMIKGASEKYCKFHNCEIDDSALRLAVVLSDRYIKNRRLPDKAISVIDQTAAHIKNNNNETTDNVVKITSSDIRETISRITGVDIDDITGDDKEKLIKLAENIRKSLVGQDTAVDAVTKSIWRAKAGIKDPNRPVGSFLFVGPTGVGKTELVKQLAKAYTGSVDNLIRIDMSEYMEKFNVSRMIGSPPGYVGYGEGGQLTEAIKNNPSAIVLFDEIEKAHPDVFNIMLQILDEGQLTDGQGRKVDFRNSIIVMTSNAGYRGLEESKSIGFNSFEHLKSPEDIEKDALKALESTFRPEFLNRIDRVVVFNSLSKENCTSIIEIELSKISERLSENGISLSWDKSVVDHILDIGYSEKYGARNLKRKAQEFIEDALAEKIILGDICSGDTVKLCVDQEEIKIDKKNKKDAVKIMQGLKNEFNAVE